MAEDTAPVVPVPGLRIEELVPIDRHGNFDAKWNVMTPVMIKAGRLGKHFSSPPANTILGSGTYGKVWRAKHSATGACFAVKNLRARAAAREREVFAHLQTSPHPYVVSLFHVQDFADTNSCSLVMDLCSGGDLMERMKHVRRRGTYSPPAQSRMWMAQVYLGLEHMHSSSACLFRDLKPPNVLLDAQDKVKLSDFGVSRVGTESCGTWTFGNPAGSPGYVAPEILKQEEYNYQADLYSFGVLLWVVLSGGLSEYEDPQPPSNIRNMRRTPQGPDYSALFEDFRLLRSQAEDVSGTLAPAVLGDGQDLVLRLVVEKAGDRLDHAGVREHPYLSVLNLPSADAGFETITAWHDMQSELVVRSAPEEDIGGD